jgi:glutamate synthase domain-containing protein 3
MTRGTVVVLGTVGTNFGAGMTGGVAYVFDPGGSIASRVNPDFVRVDTPGPADEALLLRLLRQHVFHTGSPAGQALLDAWAAHRRAFAKVAPVALDIVDFRAIHDATVESRLGVLLNE